MVSVDCSIPMQAFVEMAPKREELPLLAAVSTGVFHHKHPDPMRTYRSPQRIVGLGAAILLQLGLAHAATPPLTRTAADAVELTGWLHVDDLIMNDVVVEVEVDGRLLTIPVTENGRFTVLLPANAEAVLHIEKPGHLPKKVMLDTRHVHDGTQGPKTRKLSFAVILEVERRMGGLTYLGPVGSIGFDEGGGCVAVAHTKKLVPARRNKPMVF